MRTLSRRTRVAAVVGVLLMLSVVAAVWAGRLEARTSVGGREIVACSAHLLSGVGIGTSPDGRSATAWVGSQSVRVSAEEVEVVGVRTVRLPAACRTVELIETRGGVRILLDGTRAD